MAGTAYSFPADLDDSPEYGHLMVFTAYTPQSARFASAAPAAGQVFDYAGQTVNLGGFADNTAGETLRAAGAAISSTGSRKMLEQFHLFVPGGGENNMSWRQQHDYDDVKMSRLGTGAASGIMSPLTGIGAETIKKAGTVAGGIFRTQINPAVEVLYRGTDLRKYNFSFVFAPQSYADSLQLYGDGTPGTGILNRFRYYSAPEFAGPNDVLFLSPSEWEIDFLYKTSGGWAVNSRLPKVAKGVLTFVDVDYNPDTEFSTFENGDPTSSRLTMEFVEMEIIDKGRIKEGF